MQTKHLNFTDFTGLEIIQKIWVSFGNPLPQNGFPQHSQGFRLCLARKKNAIVLTLMPLVHWKVDIKSFQTVYDAPILLTTRKKGLLAPIIGFLPSFWGVSEIQKPSNFESWKISGFSSYHPLYP